MRPDVAYDRGIGHMLILRRFRLYIARFGYPFIQASVKQIHPPEKAIDERSGRIVVYLLWRSYLFNPPLVHDDDPISHFKGLLLIVSNKNRSHFQSLV